MHCLIVALEHLDISCNLFIFLAWNTCGLLVNGLGIGIESKLGLYLRMRGLTRICWWYLGADSCPHADVLVHRVELEGHLRQLSVEVKRSFVLDDLVNHIHAGVVDRGEMTVTFLVEVGELERRLDHTKIVHLGGDDRIFEVALFFEIVDIWHHHRGLRTMDLLLRGLNITIDTTHIESILCLLFLFTHLFKLLLDMLLLFPLGIDHINSGIEVILDLFHLLCNHVFHALIIFRYAVSCPLVDLAHDFVEHFGLKLILQELVHGSKSWKTLELLVHLTLPVLLKLLFELSFGLLSCILYLLDTCK